LIGLSLRRRVREIWQRLANLDARPAQIAAGFAVGIAAGLVPLNPSPIVLAAAVAWLLRMNMVAAIAGGTLAILYTPLLPLIWLAEYRTGGLLLAVKHPLSFDHVSLLELAQMGWDVYAAMLVGSVIIATPVSLVAFLIVKKLAERWARLKSQSGHSV
jgi:uncharacterized protein (DUF2062 family)